MFASEDSQRNPSFQEWLDNAEAFLSQFPDSLR
jgi:hypothetical protein